MILIKHIPGLQQLLEIYSGKLFSIGFVPTMGALHDGHISLIEASRSQHPITVCSIFVNPTQFNNPLDFQKYPVTIEEDIRMLEAAGCDILFLPSAAEMYPSNEPVQHYELGYIETVLEGAHRPGHFQGVCRIVDKLLTIVQPHTLYLGQKDYQQCMVIQKLIALRNFETRLAICPTRREESGLAMSSRNMRLTDDEKKLAAQLFATLQQMKQSLARERTAEIEKEALQGLTKNGFDVDYVAIADAATLEPVTQLKDDQKLVALVAASVNGVRLIDNMLLN